MGRHGACVPQVQHKAILPACLSLRLRTPLDGERDGGCAASPASLEEPLTPTLHFNCSDPITKQRKWGERKGGS